MLRFKVLASVLPLAAAAVFARAELLPGPRPCIEVGGAALQIASHPWLAHAHVSFTDDPRRSTVRVQITDSAELADFTVIDDVDDREAIGDRETGACESSTVPQLIAISSDPRPNDPVIYLSQDGPSDYRVFVQSKTFSARDAAALIVSARGEPRPVEEASLPSEAPVHVPMLAALTAR
ncbi:hypothetical protein [Bradyrhizobium sp. CCBAU 51753]|uniref:hypothetical protein n=1 Tax=Bradyrhizobium sp. CCBAU 51753 TaxID=1325100 RepID=UPI00188C2880|nr:hypothetical protein [Bradyrhizobium sp. CCBAU 51753]QOZ22363.1 hypothetical protein XH93_00870 [Bradyrhizobium sp. CCBAU 51753]